MTILTTAEAHTILERMPKCHGMPNLTKYGRLTMDASGKFSCAIILPPRVAEKQGLTISDRHRLSSYAPEIARKKGEGRFLCIIFANGAAVTLRKNGYTFFTIGHLPTPTKDN